MHCPFHSRRSSISTFALVLGLGLAACSDDDQDPSQSGALILTSDFQTGSMSSIDLDTRAVSRNIGTVHSDAVCRADADLVYVVNRLGQDNIQVLDGDAGYTTLRQFSTGNGSNPQDICLVNSTKAYVPTYGLDTILVVNPQTGQMLGQVDLSGYADADGIPEMTSCAAVGNRVFVTIQNLTNFAPTGNSAMVVINSGTDTAIKAVSLEGQNPFTKILYDEPRDRLLVGSSGVFGALDGGVEAFDVDSEESDGFVVTEQTLGGDIGAIALASRTKGYALITDASFATSVVSFNPETGQKIATVFNSADSNPNDSDFDVSAIAANDGGELYIADANFVAPGIRILDTDSDDMETSTPIDVGLPPRDICFSGP